MYSSYIYNRGPVMPISRKLNQPGKFIIPFTLGFLTAPLVYKPNYYPYYPVYYPRPPYYPVYYR